MLVNEEDTQGNLKPSSSQAILPPPPTPPPFQIPNRRTQTGDVAAGGAYLSLSAESALGPGRLEAKGGSQINLAPSCPPFPYIKTLYLFFP